MDTTTQRAAELRQAVHDLRERGIYDAAQWAGQQLVGLPACDASVPAHAPRMPHRSDTYLVARTHFDLKEYRRCAHVLQGSTDDLSIFLRCYALYLAGERQKEESRLEQVGPSGGPAPRTSPLSNSALPDLEKELSQLHKQGRADAFHMYLYALVLVDRQQTSLAQDVIIQSVSNYPCNWAAWKVLEVLCTTMAAASSLPLPNHWVKDCFLASLGATLYENETALQQLQGLAELLPHSDWVTGTTAIVQYQLRNFDEAQELFEDIVHNNPYSLDGMDAYSNILYVKEDFAALSHLAHHAATTNKYCPETCCIIGNYFSLKGAHEMAVVYFRRALRMQPHCVGAWVLMGHEFMELKNPQAAIESYRQAVDLFPRDFRAWYGLGQAYEMMQELYYALYYYKRASELRPQDARMWCAMGQCYNDEHLGQVRNAIRCYRKAVYYGDREGIALSKLAQLHRKLNEPREAAHYYKLNLERIDAEQSKGEELVEALSYLAHYCKDKLRLQEAEQYCLRLQDFGHTKHKEDAKELLAEIKQLQRNLAADPVAVTPERVNVVSMSVVGQQLMAVPTSGGSVDMVMDEQTP